MCISEICDISPSGGRTIASLRDACRACAAPSTILRLTACMVLIALCALCLSEATFYWLISLPHLRNIALNLASADVQYLVWEVFGADVGALLDNAAFRSSKT